MTPREYITQQVLKTKVFYSHKMQQQKERNSLFAKAPPQNGAPIDQSIQNQRNQNTEILLQQQIGDAEVDMGLGLVDSALKKLEDVLTVGKNNLKKEKASIIFASVFDMCNKHGSRLLKEESQLIKAHLILTKCLQWTNCFDPGSSFASIHSCVNLGECFLKRGLITQSLNTFSSALGLILQRQGSPRLAEVYLNLSRLTNKIGDHDGSLDFARRALSQILLDTKNEQISKPENLFQVESPSEKDDSEEQWTQSSIVNLIICQSNLAKNEEKFLHFDEAKRLLAAALENASEYFGENHKRTQRIQQNIQALDIRHSAFLQSNINKSLSQNKAQLSESTAARRVTTQSSSPYRLKLYIDNPAKQAQPLLANGKEKRVLSISKTKPTTKYLTQNGLTTESYTSRPLSSSRAAISARNTSQVEQKSVQDSHSNSKDASRINKFYILNSHGVQSSSSGLNSTKQIERSMNSVKQNPRIPSPRQARSKILYTARINKNTEVSDIVFSTNTTQNLNKTKEIEDTQRANSPEQKSVTLKTNESQRARGYSEFKQKKWIWTTLNTEEADIQQKKQVIVSHNPANHPHKLENYLQGRKHYLENMNRIQKEKGAYSFQLNSTNEQLTLKRSAEYVKKINEQVFLKVKEQTCPNPSNNLNSRGQQRQKSIFTLTPQYQKANQTLKPNKQFIPSCLGTDFMKSELCGEGSIVEQEQIQGNYLLYEDKECLINTINPDQNECKPHAQEQMTNQCFGNLKFYLHSNKMSIVIQFQTISPQTTDTKQLQHLMNISDLHSFSHLQLESILVSMCKKVQAFLLADCCLTVLYIQIKTQPHDQEKSIYGFPKIIEFPKEGMAIYLVKKDLANSIIYCQNIEVVSSSQNGRQMVFNQNQKQRQMQIINYAEGNQYSNNCGTENNNLSDTLQLNESGEDRENLLNESVKNSYFELFDLLDFSENCKSPESEQYDTEKNSQQKMLVGPPFSFGSRQQENNF